MRSSPSTPHQALLPGLDVLRAVAIVFVLLFHYAIYFEHPAEMRSLTSFGWTGVDLFFVLSGFLISSQLFTSQAKEGISLGRYFVKRSFRILPLFWLTLAVYFLVPVWKELKGLAPLWKYLTFTQNLYFDPLNQGAFSHAWSLCIEEQFYLVLPFVFLAVGRRLALRPLLWSLLTLMIAGFGIRWFSWEYFVATQPDEKAAQGLVWSLGWARWIYYCTQTRLDGLLVGVGIAGLFHFRKDVRARLLSHPLWFFVAGVAGLVGAWTFCTPFHTHGCALVGYPLIALSYGCLLVAAISPRFVLPKPVFFPLKWLATLSYGLYLSHKIVGHVWQPFLIRAGFDGKSWSLVAVTLLSMVAVALVLHFVIEKPSFALRDMLLARLKSPGRVAARKIEAAAETR